ncbi:MAG: formate dehydrogenase subunit delta [Hyphomicrobiaceae bacterium]
MQASDRLVHMANQIARNFAILGEEKAVAATNDHIVKFWDPRMRQLIEAHVNAGGAGLSPVALLATKALRK